MSREEWLQAKRNSLNGKKFGMLTVIGYSHTEGKHSYYKCVCDCGNEIITRRDGLVNGHTSSCGCVRDEWSHSGKLNRKHGLYDDDFVELYVVMLANFLEETTIKHKGQEYYTSYQRALELSAGEASNVLNRKDYKEAVKDGKHYKIWQSFHDEKVRATHEALDGEIKGT